ncbi:hypothetical protein VSU19_01275 [Verrucomicrobiales bacterium BCK34]|nr:hypothetical protein [Verrucomicrobiales bacterium BCK34]
MIKKFFKWLAPSPKDINPQVGGIFGNMTPEALCGIDPSQMDKEEIRKQLAMLYKRHNQAASSLNPELRDEAEEMLDAIVHCREKYVD